MNTTQYPLRRVLGYVYGNTVPSFELECGHKLSISKNDRRAKVTPTTKRRCRRCFEEGQ